MTGRAVNFRRRLDRLGELRALEQQAQIRLGLCVARNGEHSSAAARDLDLDLVHRAELLQHAARGQPGERGAFGDGRA